MAKKKGNASAVGSVLQMFGRPLGDPRGDAPQSGNGRSPLWGAPVISLLWAIGKPPVPCEDGRPERLRWLRAVEDLQGLSRTAGLQCRRSLETLRSPKAQLEIEAICVSPYRRAYRSADDVHSGAWTTGKHEPVGTPLE